MKAWVSRLETKVKPRLKWLTGRVSERLIGWIGVALSLIVSLPIPFGNALPGISIAVLTLGLIERDGVIVAAGGIFAVLSFILTFVVLLGLGNAGLWVLEGIL